MNFKSFPSYAELSDRLENMVVKNEKLAWAETVGISAEGKPIRAYHFSSSESPREEKEIVLIICGRHGDEIGTRVVGPFLIEWLTSSRAELILKKQHIIIVPIANPDGCEKEVFGLPRDRLSDLEKNSIIKIALQYIPDVVIDVHSVGKEKYGYSWGGLQAIVIDRNVQAGEDQFIFNTMANHMIEAACGKGFFFLLHDVEFYKNLPLRGRALAKGAFNNHVNRACYSAFHSLIFGLEVNHFINTPNQTGKSATAVICSLLKSGHQIFPWEFYPGYPNRILSGDFLASIRASGVSPGERRKTRQEIWKKRAGFVEPFQPYREMPNKNTLKVICKYTGMEEIECGFNMGICLMNRDRIKRVRLNGEHVDYLVKQNKCSLYIYVDVAEPQINAEDEIVVEF